MSKHIVISGANRGIGLGFVQHYLAQGDRVSALVRDAESSSDLKGLAEKNASLSIFEADMSQVDSLGSLADRIDGTIDCLINNAGAYGGREQRLGQVQAATWLDTFTINTMAPYFLTQALLPLLAKPSCVAFVSSKMGSIADNGSGGAYIYRSAKAALNAMVKSLSIDLAEREIGTVTLHPGWVKTRMGGDNALIEVEESVSGMTQVISEVNLDNSGRFVNFDGTEIPW